MVFDQLKKAQITLWKWTIGQTPEELRNRVLNYTVVNYAHDKYMKKLQLWLLPYPKDKLDPPKGLIPLMAVVQN